MSVLSPTRLASLCVAVLFALVMSACAGAGSGAAPSATAEEPSASASPTAEPTSSPTPEPTPTPTPDLTAYRDCSELLEPLQDTLRQIDSRLAVGINFSEFDELVDTAAVEYGRIDADELAEIDFACLSAGAEIESMLQAYIDAHGLWGDCIDDLECDLDSVDPELQELWVTAEEHLDAADEELNGMRQ